MTHTIDDEIKYLVDWEVPKWFNSDQTKDFFMSRIFTLTQLFEAEKQAYAKQQVSEALEKVEQYVDSKYDLCAELCTYDGGKQEAAYDVLRFMKTLLSQYDNNKQGAQVEK